MTHYPQALLLIWLVTKVQVLGVVCLSAANGPELVPRGRGEVELVHHAGPGQVGGGHTRPHGVLKLQTLEVNPHLAHAGVTLK